MNGNVQIQISRDTSLTYALFRLEQIASDIEGCLKYFWVTDRHTSAYRGMGLQHHHFVDYLYGNNSVIVEESLFFL